MSKEKKNEEREQKLNLETRISFSAYTKFLPVNGRAWHTSYGLRVCVPTQVDVRRSKKRNQRKRMLAGVLGMLKPSCGALDTSLQISHGRSVKKQFFTSLIKTCNFSQIG